ncbi:MAG: hypothetical protein CL867_06975 [Cytophagaceae bacterium]|nr:hypothetical protein [Cytophagaceae bacterium]
MIFFTVVIGVLIGETFLGRKQCDFKTMLACFFKISRNKQNRIRLSKFVFRIVEMPLFTALLIFGSPF